MRIYVIIAILNALDLLTTHIGVNILGFDEVNSIARTIIGSWIIVPYKLGLTAMLIYLVWLIIRDFKAVSKYVTIGTITFLTLVVLWNTFQILTNFI